MITNSWKVGTVVVVLLSVLTLTTIAAQDQDRILFTNAVIDLGADWAGIPSDWLDTGAGTGYYVVHFAEKITGDLRRELAALGAQVAHYVPDNAYIVRLDGSQLDAVSELASVDWVGLYQPYLKVDLSLLDPSRNQPETKIRVSLYGGETFANALAAINYAGGVINEQTDGKHRLRISFTIATAKVYEVVRALAFLREVYWIQSYPEYKLCNDYTQWVCQSGPYGSQATPLYDHGVKGAGQIIGVMDTGADPDMCYFYDSAQGVIVPNAPPNYAQRKIVAYIGPDTYVSDFDSNSHGTHTAGTIAGDNFANSGVHDAGDGIGLLAQLVIQDYGNSYDVYPPDDEYEAHQAVYDIGGRVHSNSWGWPSNAGVYHDDCEEVDQFIWDNPTYNIVYAAGNEGSSADTIRPPGTSKNVITVGATESGNAQPENNESFSSHGPTNDGRRKPDVTMPGGDIISAASDSNPGSYNCSTSTKSGTSMATPGVAGAAALVRDYFNQGFYPLGIADPAFALEPSAALVKATLINSGANMTGTYTADSGSGHADIPSQGQGWGRVTLDDTLFFFNDERLLWIEDNDTGLSTGGAEEFYLAVSDTTLPLEVTLVWSDYPSTPSAALNLVNDLDLTVTGGGETFKGNVYASGQSTPGGSYDRLNNVECVQINTPAIGAYVVRVEGYNVPQGPQKFALVVTGALSFSDGVVSLDAAKYACASEGSIIVSDADLAGLGSQPVTVVSTVDPTGETIALTETSANSGVFSGTVEFTTSAPGSGQVQVAHAAEVTVTYIDADDGHGGLNVPKTDVATIDCVAPMISNVVVAWYSSSGARITWQTNEPCTSRVDYGITTPPDLYVMTSGLTTTHEVELAGLLECGDYLFSVSSQDEAGNATTDDNAGNYYAFTTYAVFIMLEENMDTNPQWTISGGSWAWGQPTGGGGASGEPDPTSGYTGTNVYGYNLAGDYANSMPEYTLTTPAFNCSNAQGTVLSFYRILGVESASYDHARLKISTDGSTWNTIWENPSSSMSDSQWTQLTYDISTYADGEPTVYLRWTMGTTDGSVVYCGWNIDDVMISYEAPCNAPNIVYSTHVVDDSAGDTDGNMDIGEPIVLQVSLRNLGLDATNVSATLSTANPHITITGNTVVFGDIGQSEIVPSQDPHYLLTVASDVEDLEPVLFNLAWTADQGSGIASFAEVIHAPNLAYYTHRVDDASGDDDGIMDPGETVTLPVTLENNGSDEGYNVTATLTVDVASYITIDDNAAVFGTINPSEQVETQAPHFQVSVSESIPDPITATFTLTVSTTNGYTTTTTFATVITSSTFARRYYYPLDTDPGWVGTNQWAWGVPAGLGGDPSSGYTGANVYGYNLQGAYPNSMQEETLTSGVLNCSTFWNTEIRFNRWLGVESATWDHARFQISTNGTNFTTIWENTTTMMDTSWQSLVYDLSQYADFQPVVYLRWTMGPTDGSVTYCGWNIDDIEIWAESGNPSSPTPSPTGSPATPTRTPTSVPTVTVTPTRTGTVTPTRTATVTPTRTFTPTEPPTSTPTATVTEPPTATQVPPSVTPVPPTATPAPPTETAVPTATLQPTQEPTVQPSPTPGCPTTGITCDLNDTFYTPGELFRLTVEACNGLATELPVEVYIILDVYGNYWFWPTWTQDLDFEAWTLPACDCKSETILEFTWPAGSGAANGILFWTGMLEPGTVNLVGEIGYCGFDYEE